MKERSVVFAPEAETDLITLYDWIAGMASPTVAVGYIGRI